MEIREQDVERSPVSLSSAPLTPVVLSGGSGTRLWPLSRAHSPKQFLPLVEAQSLFQATLLRLRELDRTTQPPLVVCNEAHYSLVAGQLHELDVRAGAIVLEPAARNTAPAVAAAALLALETSASALLLVLPADHVITDSAAFARAVTAAAEAAAAGYLVTFGVVPTRPETGYGYLRRGAVQGSWEELEHFVEKPSLDAASAYVASGRYLWNSGMFLFSAHSYLAELANHAPRMLEACKRAVAAAERGADRTRLGPAFADCESISVDYAVMEKTRRAAVVPLDAGWSDVGSWPALHDALPKDDGGNVLTGNVLASACKDSYIVSSGRFVAALGLEGVVVVETPDAVLVMARDHAQGVKQVAESQQARAATRPPHGD